MAERNKQKNNGAQWPAPGTSGGGPAIPAGNPVVKTRTNGKANDNGKAW